MWVIQKQEGEIEIYSREKALAVGLQRLQDANCGWHGCAPLIPPIASSYMKALALFSARQRRFLLHDCVDGCTRT